MDLSSTLRIAATIATAAAGVYGTAFDLKKDGRVTRHGRVVVGAITISCLTALGIQVRDAHIASEAAQELQRQNDRQNIILTNTLSANDALAQTIGRLKLLQTDLTNYSKETGSRLEAQRRLAAKLSTDIDRASRKTLMNVAATTYALRELNAGTSRTLAQLDRPLHHVAFSYTILFDHADQRFPEYFKRIQALAIRQRQNLRTNLGVGLERDDPSFVEISGDSVALPADGDGRAITQLGSEWSRVGFGWDSDLTSMPGYEAKGKPYRMYQLYYRPELRSLDWRDGSWVDLIFDLTAKTIQKHVVIRNDVSLIYGDEYFTSELDLLGEDVRRHIVVDLQLNGTIGPPTPKIVDFEVQLGESRRQALIASQDDLAQAKVTGTTTRFSLSLPARN